MNRRSFIKRAAIAIAGISAGATLLTDRVTAQPAPFRFDTDPSPVRYKINPAYLTAPYEVEFLSEQAFRLTGPIADAVSRPSIFISLL